MKSLIKSKYLIVGILGLALLMRLIAINQSLWLDEAIGALAIRDLSYKEIFTSFLKVDNHPPLYYLLLKFWSGIFGYSELSLRFPSVLFGLGTIYVTYKIAQKLTDSRYFPLISAMLIATSQFHIYYSQEARMYSMAAFFASLTIYLFINLLRESDHTLVWLTFSLALTVLIFTDYVPFFLLPVFWIWSYFSKKNRRWWLLFSFSHIPILIFGIIWLPIFLIQSQSGKWLLQTLPNWREIAGGANFKQVALVWMKFVLGRISLPRKIYYYVLVLLASIPVFASIVIGFVSERKRLALIYYWLFFPLLLGYLISIWLPVFTYFRFVYVLPAFYILISSGVSSVGLKPIRNLLIILLVGVNLVGWIIYISDKKQQREDWKNAVSFIESNLRDNEVVIFEYPEPFAPYRWYEKKANTSFGVTDSISADRIITGENTQKVIKSAGGVYYFEYLRDLSDPARVVEETLTESGYKRNEIYDFSGLGQVYYWKLYD